MKRGRRAPPLATTAGAAAAALAVKGLAAEARRVRRPPRLLPLLLRIMVVGGGEAKTRKKKARRLVVVVGRRTRIQQQQQRVRRCGEGAKAAEECWVAVWLVCGWFGKRVCGCAKSARLSEIDASWNKNTQASASIESIDPIDRSQSNWIDPSL